MIINDYAGVAGVQKCQSPGHYRPLRVSHNKNPVFTLLPQFADWPSFEA